jgi:four helix bundle protein
VRANYRASRRGRSRAEFEATLGIVFEEADECVDQLQYLADTRIRCDEALLAEARELASIIAAAVRTARLNSARMKRQPRS